MLIARFLDWLLFGPEKPEKFCRRCGKELIPDATVRGYDGYTGVACQPYLHLLTCPDWYCGIRLITPGTHNC